MTVPSRVSIGVYPMPRLLRRKGVYGAALTAGPGRVAIVIPLPPENEREMATVFHELLHVHDYATGQVTPHATIHQASARHARAYLSGSALEDSPATPFVEHVIRDHPLIAEALQKGRQHVLDRRARAEG